MTKFKGQVGSVKLIGGLNGAFEVSVDGEQIHSKWDTGRFPDLKEITDQVEAKVPSAV
jgi:selT/selW/selH-like putative selenoprotein